MKTNIIQIASHRNGICGAPFDVVLFEDSGPEGSRKAGIVFDEPHQCAVLDIDKLAAGDITFGSNSFRVDTYEPHLRGAICATSGGVTDMGDRAFKIFHDQWRISRTVYLHWHGCHVPELLAELAELKPEPTGAESCLRQRTFHFHFIQPLSASIRRHGFPPPEVKPAPLS